MKKEYRIPVAILSMLHACDVLAASGEPTLPDDPITPTPGGDVTPDVPTVSDPAASDLDWN